MFKFIKLTNEENACLTPGQITIGAGEGTLFFGASDANISFNENDTGEVEVNATVKGTGYFIAFTKAAKILNDGKFIRKTTKVDVLKGSVSRV